MYVWWLGFSSDTDEVGRNILSICEEKKNSRKLTVILLYTVNEEMW